MTRQTSIEAYHIIRDNGLLSKRRWEVYDMIYKLWPATISEVFVALQNEHKGARNPTSNSASRFSELREMGVIVELGEKQCGVTGNQVIAWGITDRLPKKIIKTTKIKCIACNGMGYHEQENLF